MNKMQIFCNDNFGEIRALEENGKVLFCGSDVAKAWGYAIPSKAVNTHCKGVSKMEAPSPRGTQTMLFISEGDMYRLIIHSKLPSAEKFEKWVFDEILPSIRTTGQYIDTENKFQQYCPVSFKRAKCQKIVQLYALRKRRSPMHEIDAWRKLYIDFSKQIGYNINTKAKEEGVSKIEYMEKNDLIDQFVSFVENAIA